MNSKLKTAIIILILILSPLLWVNFQMKIDDKIGKDKQIESLVYIPSGEFLSLLTLGYRDVFANFLWMKTSIYFGSHYQTDKDYEWLYRLIDSITDLDKSFHQPYMFGGISLANEVGNIEHSNAILYKGWKNLPNEWQFPFYIGFNYFFFEKDFKRSAMFIKAASEMEGSPPYLKAMYIEFLYKGGSPEIGRAFLLQSLEHVGNEEMKLELLKKLEEYDKDIMELKSKAEAATKTEEVKVEEKSSVFE